MTQPKKQYSFEEAQASSLLEQQLRRFYNQPIPQFTVKDAAQTLLGQLFSYLFGSHAMSVQQAWQQVTAEIRKYQGQYQQSLYADYVIKNRIERLAEQTIKKYMLRPLGLYEQKKFGKEKVLGIKIFNSWNHWLNQGLNKFARWMVKDPTTAPWSTRSIIAQNLYSAIEYEAVPLFGQRKKHLIPRAGKIKIGKIKKRGKRKNLILSLIMTVIEGAVAAVLNKIGLADKIYKITNAAKGFVSDKWSDFLDAHPKFAKIYQPFSMATSATWAGVKALIPAAGWGFGSYYACRLLGASQGLSIGIGSSVGVLRFGTAFVKNLATSDIWLSWAQRKIATQELLYFQRYGVMPGSKFGLPRFHANPLAKGIRFYHVNKSIPRWFFRKFIVAKPLFHLRKVPGAGRLVRFGFRTVKFFKTLPTTHPNLYQLINNFFNPGLFLGFTIGQAMGLAWWQTGLMAIGGSLTWTIGQRVLYNWLSQQLLAANSARLAVGLPPLVSSIPEFHAFVRGGTAAGFLGQLLGLGIGFGLQALGIPYSFLIGQITGTFLGLGFYMWGLSGFILPQWLGALGSSITTLLTSLAGSSFAVGLGVVATYLTIASITIITVFVAVVAISAIIIEIKTELYPVSESECFVFNVTAHNANSHANFNIDSLSYENLTSMSQATTRDARNNDFILIHKQVITKDELKSSKPEISITDDDIPGSKWTPPPKEKSLIFDTERSFRVFKNGTDITNEVDYFYRIEPELNGNHWDFTVPLTDTVSTEIITQPILDVLRRYYPNCPDLPDTDGCQFLKIAKDHYLYELDRERAMLEFKKDKTKTLLTKVEAVLKRLEPDQPLDRKEIDTFESLYKNAQTDYEFQDDYDCPAGAGNTSSLAYYICEREKELDTCSSLSTPEEINECQTHNHNLISIYQTHLSIYQDQASTLEYIFEFLSLNQDNPDSLSVFLNNHRETLQTELEEAQAALQANTENKEIAKDPEKKFKQISEQDYYTAPVGTTFDLFYIAKYTGPDDEEAAIKGGASAKIPNALNLPADYCTAQRTWRLNSQVATLIEDLITILRGCYGPNIESADFQTDADGSCMTNKDISNDTAQTIMKSSRTYSYLQCVGFAQAFASHSGSSLPGQSKAADYIYKSTFGYRFNSDAANAQPGDYLIFKASADDPYGHIGVVIDVQSSVGYTKIIFADANADYHGGLRNGEDDDAIVYIDNPHVAGYLTNKHPRE